MAEDFLKLHRKMLNWGWYDDVNTCRVFLHCLLRANWKPGTWHGIEYDVGEFITSLETLAKETKLTINQVRTALTHLKSTGEITSKSHSKCRLITVNNWSQYQSDHKQEPRQATSKPQASHKQATTDKDIKIKRYKDIKINNIIPPSVEMVRAYCQERNNTVDPEAFVSFYESKGWMIGKNKMKDWQSAVRTWEKNRKGAGSNESRVGRTTQSDEEQRNAEIDRYLESDEFRNAKDDLPFV